MRPASPRLQIPTDTRKHTQMVPDNEVQGDHLRALSAAWNGNLQTRMRRTPMQASVDDETVNAAVIDWGFLPFAR